MKIQFVTKAQEAETKAIEIKRQQIALDRMKFLGRLLQAVRDARDYMLHNAPPLGSARMAEYDRYKDVLTELGSLLDRDENKDSRE